MVSVVSWLALAPFILGGMQKTIFLIFSTKKEGFLEIL